MARLVVLIGPIGAGKSTVASLLAGRLVATGRSVAVADVDDVAAMASAPPAWQGDLWPEAHAAHGALVAGWLRTSVDVVIAHGPIYTEKETAALLASVPADTDILRALLLVSFATALDRVAGDPLRGLSKDPRFLRAAHERFGALRPGLAPSDLTFDTEDHRAEEIARRISERLS